MTTLDERLTADLERTADERDAARENARRAIQERDAALVKISKVAEMCVPLMSVRDPDGAKLLATNVLRVLGACPTCGVLGRIADAPCTHMGPAADGS